MATEIEVKLNPWLSIWIHPRKTLGQLKNNNQQNLQWVFTIGFLLGVLGGLNQLWFRLDVENEFVFYLVVAVMLLGGFLGIGLIYLFSWLIAKTGKWIEGKARTKDVVKVYVWSSVPILVGQLFTAPLWWGMGKDLLNIERNIMDFSPNMLFLFICVMAIQGILAVWSLVILFAGLSEVQGFSIGKSILNILLFNACIFGVIFVLIVMLLWAYISLM